MEAFSLAMMVALSAAPVKPAPVDIDAPIQAAITQIDSPELRDHVTAAMAWPYKYGVSQLTCKAQSMEPQRGWRAVREPAGRIEWVQGPVTKVLWSGIYGTCFIQTPRPRGELPLVEAIGLECECNGWMPAR